MVNFNTSNKTYRQLMGNGLIYTIPRFQRDYSWTEVEWDELWNDLTEMLDSGGEPAHYMGYLVLQTMDNKNFAVIDGQQRLSTMSLIILAVLANLRTLVEQGVDSSNNDQREKQLRGTFIGYLDPVTLIPKSKLTLNRNNDDVYQRYLVPLQQAPRRGLKATEHLLRKAFEWFSLAVTKKYGVQRDGMVLAKFVDQLADRLFFTVIEVGDELNAYKVFETLNARGVKLSSTDLLKNYLFSVVHSGGGTEREFQELDNRWERLTGQLGSDSFPDFLRTHWNSRKRFVRHSELFKRMREAIRDMAAVFGLLRDMESDTETYIALSKPEDEFWTQQQRPYVRELNMFSVNQHYPLLLAAQRILNPQDLEGLLRVCSIIAFRYNVIGGFNPNEMERVYNATAEKIAMGVLKDLKSIVLELRSIYVNDEQFKSAFSEKQLKTTQSRNKTIMRYILFKLEKQVSGNDFDFDSTTYNLEHILPENPGPGWEHVSDREHEQLVYRIGNLTPMNATANRHIGNGDFESKKPAYAASEFEITKKVGTETHPWDASRISARQRSLAGPAVSVWRVGQLS